MSTFFRTTQTVAHKPRQLFKQPLSIVLSIFLLFSGMYLLSKVLVLIRPPIPFPFDNVDEWLRWMSVGTVGYAMLWIFGWTILKVVKSAKAKSAAEPESNSAEYETGERKNAKSIRKALYWKSTIVAGGSAGILCGVMLWGLHGVVDVFASDERVFVIMCPLLMITLFTIVAMFQIGLAGNGLRDHMREWWSRFGAWILICSLAWAVFLGFAFFSKEIVGFLVEKIGGMSLSFTWLAATISGLFAAKSDKTGSKRSNRWLEMFAKFTPYFFTVGFVLLVSYLMNVFLPMERREPWLWGIISASCFILSLVLSWRVDINEFSMHSMYRNRLVRCYLGASRKRDFHPFTGFDEADDEFNVADFQPLRDGYRGPYPIVNTAINLVHGEELAWQTRKSSSFAFTPRYCGFTGPKGDVFGTTPDDVTLGSAITISGAAVSPNMGYHSSAVLSFMMTLFNARLGQWFLNPKKTPEEYTHGPRLGLLYLYVELFGLTNDQRKYVYLSDGGHFENLGLYELVRRRCRFIIISDAGQDPNCTCADLGFAIEKCRTDFNVEVDVNVSQIQNLGDDGYQDMHYAVGSVHYPEQNGESSTGVIVYIKTSLTGDEPTDVLSYRSTEKDFPHQSTADQWFDESQFESYRALGYHVANKVFGEVGKGENARTPGENLIWYFSNLKA